MNSESDPHSAQRHDYRTAPKKSHAPKVFTAQIRLQSSTIPRINEFNIFFFRIAITSKLTKSLCTYTATVQLVSMLAHGKKLSISHSSFSFIAFLCISISYRSIFPHAHSKAMAVSMLIAHPARQQLASPVYTNMQAAYSSPVSDRSYVIRF